MFSISADFSGHDPQKIGKQVEDAMQKAQEELAALALQKIRAVLPRDTGALVDSLTSNDKGAVLEISMSGYVLEQEYGLPSGYSSPSKDQLISDLSEWVLRKRMTYSFELAQLIAARILKKWQEEGREARGFLGLAFEGTIPSGSVHDGIPIEGGLVDSLFDDYYRIFSLEMEKLL